MSEDEEERDSPFRKWVDVVEQLLLRVVVAAVLILRWVLIVLVGKFGPPAFLLVIKARQLLDRDGDSQQQDGEGQ